jgi:hypothetical protein
MINFILLGIVILVVGFIGFNDVEYFLQIINPLLILCFVFELFFWYSIAEHLENKN